MKWSDILAFTDNALTIIGAWAVFKTVIFLFFYFKEKDHYIECIYKRFFDTTVQDIEKEYPVRKILILNEEANEFFVIGFPGNAQRNIKIYEWKSWNKLTKRLNYRKTQTLRETITSDEYLLVQCYSAETIPAHRITCRVDGYLVEFNFEFNGIYGFPDKNHKEVKHDLYSLLHSYFRSSI